MRESPCHQVNRLKNLKRPHLLHHLKDDSDYF